MASGNFTFTTSNKYITGRIEWSSSSNINNNNSNVSATLSYMKSSSSTAGTTGTFNGNITIDGTKTDFSKRISLPTNNSWVTIGTTSKTVGHNSDGTKSISISASGGCSGTSFSSSYGSKTVSLDTIPRTSSAWLSNASPEFGNEITININRASGNFTHTVQQDFYAGSWTNIATGVGTSCKWTVPNDYMHRIPNATNGGGRIRVITYSGGTYIGEVSLNFTAYVPGWVKPEVTALDTWPVGADVGGYVQGKHQVGVHMAGNWHWGATYSSVSISVDGQTHWGTDITSQTIWSSGEKYVETTMRDSRGRTATKGKTIHFWGYWNPGASISAYRCNSSGNRDDVNGTHARIEVRGNACNVGEVNRNAPVCKVYWKYTESSSWIEYYTIGNSVSGANYNINDIRILDGFDINRAYDLKVNVSDKWVTATGSANIQTGFTTMDFKVGGKGVAIGKIAEYDCFDIGMEVRVRGGGLAGHCPFYIANGEDFNTKVIPGDYFNSSSSDTSNMQNIPERSAFYLEVRKVGGIVSQRFYVYNGDRFFIRYYADWSNTWVGWRKYENGGVVSDINEKENISSIDLTYEKLFNDIEPIQFNYKAKYCDKQMHLGFSAQNIASSLEEADKKEFAGLVVREEVDMDTLKSKTNLFVNYQEFIPLNTYMIKKLQNELFKTQDRISLLEESNKELNNKINDILKVVNIN